jgi:stress response protein SCP2
MIIGLGWTTSGHKDIDFDASIVCLDSNKNVTAIVNFLEKFDHGIVHMGDNCDGKDSSGD